MSKCQNKRMFYDLYEWVTREKSCQKKKICGVFTFMLVYGVLHCLRNYLILVKLLHTPTFFDASWALN